MTYSNTFSTIVQDFLAIVEKAESVVAQTSESKQRFIQYDAQREDYGVMGWWW